jgi:hypothetical protein
MALSSMEDVYFLTGLPFRGIALSVDPQLSGNERLVNLVHRHWLGPNPMLGSIICIEVIDELLTHYISAMVVRIFRSLVTQRITRGQLRIMERVLYGDHFSWGLMLHARMMGKIHQCWITESGDFVFGLILVA